MRKADCLIPRWLENGGLVTHLSLHPGAVLFVLFVLFSFCLPEGLHDPQNWGHIVYPTIIPTWYMDHKPC